MKRTANILMKLNFLKVVRVWIKIYEDTYAVSMSFGDVYGGKEVSEL